MLVNGNDCRIEEEFVVSKGLFRMLGAFTTDDRDFARTLLMK